ncbi:MAG: hypothetical protein ACI80W_000602, partial [Porticoccaceae bacterium]
CRPRDLVKNLNEIKAKREVTALPSLDSLYKSLDQL